MKVFAIAVCLVALSATAVRAIVLAPETAAAFDRYVRLTEQRINGEIGRADRFLWIDTLPAGRRAELQRGLHHGAVVIEKLETLQNGKEIDAPDGLIHHWLGVAFVPNASVKEAVTLMQDYDRHSRYFAPAIARSKTLERNGNRFKVALRFHVKKVITVTMDTVNEAEFFFPSPDRAYSRIRSTHVQELADAGTPQERTKAAGEEHGFMWNLNTYWRFVERDGGTYIQCESLTLSRDVPFALAWIIRPIVTQMPKESLNFTMGRARHALLK
jgi:hypothetical protein